MGVKEPLLSWINHFSIGTQPVTKVNNTSSVPSTVTSGIPQGSVLGPVLFVLFINDLPGVFQNNTTGSLFADDTKVYSKISCPESSINLQKVINNMQKWLEEWQLHFNDQKCHILSIKHNSMFHDFTYQLGSKAIDISVEERGLGINIDTNLTFSKHRDDHSQSQ